MGSLGFTAAGDNPPLIIPIPENRYTPGFLRFKLLGHASTGRGTPA